MPRRNSVSQKNTSEQETDWMKFFMGNFAPDEYPNPTKVDPQWYPDLLPPQEQAAAAEARAYQRRLQDPSGMPLPGWEGNPRVEVPNNLAEIYSRGPQGRGSRRPEYMPPPSQITNTNRLVLDPGTPSPAPQAPVNNFAGENARRMQSVPPALVNGNAGAPQSMWDRYRATQRSRATPGESLSDRKMFSGY